MSSINAVIYARFSSHAQNEQSIEGQLQACYEYADRHGIKVVGEYIDRALSARTDDRPEFLRMISDSKKKQFQYVLVYKLDRFARNRYDSAIYKYKLKQNGIKVISVMENIGDNPESIILEAVLEASAEYYSIDLAQKVNRGMHQNAHKGKFNGGTIPYGYKSIGGKLVLDEKTAPMMKYVLESYAEGIPMKTIIDTINERGYRNRKGKKFGYTSFHHALRNKIYAGVLAWNGIEVSGGCPAIIDKETFDKNQARLALNRRTAGKNKSKANYALTGKLYCGNCGSTMPGVSGKGRGGEVYYYYSCRNRRLNRACDKAHEKKDFLEWYIVEQTIEYVLNPVRIPIIAKAVVEQYDQDFNRDKIRELEQRIAQLERDINKYTDMLLDAPKAARIQLYDRIENCDAQKTDLEIDLHKLRIANGIRFTEEDIIAWLKMFCKGDLFDEVFREKIIDVFINSIYLYDDKVVIFYNIRGGKQVSYIDMLEATEDELVSMEDLENKKPHPEDAVRIHNEMVGHHGFEPGTP